MTLIDLNLLVGRARVPGNVRIFLREAERRMRRFRREHRIPGFIPSPLGEMVEYSPTLNETLVCLGIWAFGFLAYTVFLRMSIPILQGLISKSNEGGADQCMFEGREGVAERGCNQKWRIEAAHAVEEAKH